MYEQRLITAFNFDVTLLRSPAIEAGSNLALANIRIEEDQAKLCDGGFQECTGLEIETDVAEYLEGGRNDGVIQRVGRAKYVPLVLKRGMFFKAEEGEPADEDAAASREIWDWLQGVASGRRPVQRYDGVIRLRLRRPGEDSTVVATWVFERGLPAKVVGPQLNAETGKLAIEELHIAHEGLRLEAG